MSAPVAKNAGKQSKRDLETANALFKVNTEARLPLERIAAPTDRHYRMRMAHQGLLNANPRKSGVLNAVIGYAALFGTAHIVLILAFQVIPALRKTDPVTLEQCREAMLAEGASELGLPGRPQLRFSTLAEAEAAITRLGRHLPASEPVWTIAEEYGRVEA